MLTARLGTAQITVALFVPVIPLVERSGIDHLPVAIVRRASYCLRESVRWSVASKLPRSPWRTVTSRATIGSDFHAHRGHRQRMHRNARSTDFHLKGGLAQNSARSPDRVGILNLDVTCIERGNAKFAVTVDTEIVCAIEFQFRAASLRNGDRIARHQRRS